MDKCRALAQLAMTALSALFLCCGSAYGAASDERSHVIELWQQNRIDEALRVLDSAISREPADLGERRLRAEILRSQKRYSESLKELNFLVNRMSDLQSIYDRGRLHALMGQHESAIKDFTAFLKRHGDIWCAFHARAKSHFALGEYKRCLIDCEAAVKQDACRQTYLLRAEVFEKLGNIELAQKQRKLASDLKDCPEEIAIGYGPRSLEHCLYSARCAARDGDFKFAAESANSALQIDPRSPEAYMIRAQLREIDKNTSQALKDLSSAIVSAPNHAIGYARRAALYMRLNQPARALSDYDKCVTREPDNSLYRLSRAFLRLKFKNYKGAIEDCTACLDDKDASIYAYEVRARAYEGLGNQQGMQNDRDLIKVMVKLSDAHGVVGDSNSTDAKIDSVVGGNKVDLPFSLPSNVSTPLEKLSVPAKSEPAKQESVEPASESSSSKVIATQGNLRKDAFGVSYYDVNTIVNSDGRIDLAEPGMPFGSIRLYRTTRAGKRLPDE